MQHRTTKAEQEQLISDYIDGVQVKELAIKYHISTVAIYGLLKRRGFTMKPQTEAQRKYSIDESFFDSIDTEEKAYFVGFLFADGYNNTERHSVNLSLAEKDREILEQLSACLKTNKPLQYVEYHNGNTSNQYRLVIANKHISEQLESLGCTRAKTFTCEFPSWISQEMKRHFLRGYFDGDGHIGLTKHVARFEIVGTEKFCESVAELLMQECNVNSSIRARHPNRKNNIRQLKVCGNRQILKVLHYIYDNSQIYLKRKYEKYIEILDMHNTITTKHDRYCKICGSKIKKGFYCRKCQYHYLGGKEKRRERYLNTGK